MRSSQLFAVLAVAGLAMFGGNAPASAASAGAAFAPSGTQIVDRMSDLTKVGYHYRHHYRHRRHHYGYHYRRRHYRRRHYGHWNHYRHHRRHHYRHYY